MTSAASSQERRRALKACDACRSRRSKCVRPYPTVTRCQACEDLGTECTSDTVSRKRGPPKGIKLGPRRPNSYSRAGGSSGSIAHSSSGADDQDPNRDTSEQLQLGDSQSPSSHGDSPTPIPIDPFLPYQSLLPQPQPSTIISDKSDDQPRQSAFSESLPYRNTDRVGPSVQANRDRTCDDEIRQILGQLNDRIVEEYLDVYWRSIHVVWPTIYKPAFDRQSASTGILFRMVLLASLIIPSSPETQSLREAVLPYSVITRDIDAEALQLTLLQALIHQARGEKELAYDYTVDGALAVLRLNCSSKGNHDGQSEVEAQSISRASWCIWGLHQYLSENENRQPILFSSSLPFSLPSILETDELELLPNSTTHPAPRQRALVMTCFHQMCRLTFIGEQAALMAPNRRADELGRSLQYNQVPGIDALLGALDVWWDELPTSIKNAGNISLAHFCVLITRYHAVRLRLLSSTLDKRSNPDYDRQIAESARHIIDIATALAERCLLGQFGLHIYQPLSFALLCLVYDSQSAKPQPQSRQYLKKGHSTLQELSALSVVTPSHMLFFNNLIGQSATPPLT